MAGRFRKAAIGWAAVVLGLIALTSAKADPYPGHALVLTEGGTLARDLFTVSEDGKTLTAAGDLSGQAQWFVNGVRLVGIRTVYLVDTAGPSPTPTTFIPGGGYVRTLPSSGLLTDWALFESNPARPSESYTGYDSGAPGKGFADGSHWLALADPALAGKKVVNRDTFGSFTFSAPVVDNAETFRYAVGMDYLLQDGVTGRGYISMDAVPEPAFIQMAALLGIGGLCHLLRLRYAPRRHPAGGELSRRVHQ